MSEKIFQPPTLRENNAARAANHREIPGARSLTPAAPSPTGGDALRENFCSWLGADRSNE